MRLRPETLLVVDFLCALSAGGVYFFLFDVLRHTLGLPLWIVTTQLFANGAYGVCGLSIYLGGAKRMSRFPALVAMNFVYAVACLAVAAVLLVGERPLGTWLLLAEGVVIFLLALLEKRSLASAVSK